MSFKNGSFMIALGVAIAGGATSSAQAQTVTTVTFPGPGVTLSGVLYKPAGFNSAAPAPAVVMLHGCTGMWSNRDPTALNPDGTPNLQNHIEKWGLKLAQSGVVALAVDSFTPRPRPTNGQVCTFNTDCSDPNYNTCVAGQCKPSQYLWQNHCSGSSGTIFSSTIDSYTVRADDSMAAYTYLAGLAGVDSHRIAQLGWSHGAQAAMVQAAATRRSDGTVRPNSERVFATTVLFYPGCGTALGFGAPSTGSWRPYTDLLLNVGSLDPFYDNCNARAVQATSTYAAPVTFAGYQGAAHSFDDGSQTWPTAGCSQTTDDCAMRNADISSLAYLLQRLQAECLSDAECRLFASPCTSCSCVVLPYDESDPVCSQDGTAVCPDSPCAGGTAQCVQRTCINSGSAGF